MSNVETNTPTVETPNVETKASKRERRAARRKQGDVKQSKRGADETSKAEKPYTLSPTAIAVLRFIAANAGCNRKALIVHFKRGTGWSKLLGPHTKTYVGDSYGERNLAAQGFIARDNNGGYTVTAKAKKAIAK